MTQRIVGVLILALLVAVLPAWAADKDQAAIEGTWKIEKAVRGGEEMPAEKREGVTLTFKGDKLTVREKDKDEPADYSIDSSKSPKTISVKPPNDKELVGIYELSGDTLKICVVEGTERPTKFESPAGTKVMLIVLKREKK